MKKVKTNLKAKIKKNKPLTKKELKDILNASTGS